MQLVIIIELEELDVRPPRSERTRPLDRYGVVIATVKDQRRHADLGIADIDPLDVLGKTKIDPRLVASAVVVDLAPTALPPRVPFRAERLAPARQYLKRRGE
jgi:hypothetical protein